MINAKFLDLCAGTGNIGLEALSRGANKVTFLEQNVKCIQLIEQNLHTCGFDITNPQVELIRRDITQGIASLHKRDETFELIYFDPPYSARLYQKWLSQISDVRLLQTTGNTFSRTR